MNKNCVICLREFSKEPTCSKKRWDTQRKYCSWPCRAIGVGKLQESTNNPFWKGEKASYSAIHYWVKKHLGKPVECAYCGNSKRIQWASITHKAKRDLDDYIPLCSSCHKIYDLDGRKFDREKRKYFYQAVN